MYANPRRIRKNRAEAIKMEFLSLRETMLSAIAAGNIAMSESYAMQTVRSLNRLLRLRKLGGRPNCERRDCRWCR